jgi:hypothetical protein
MHTGPPDLTADSMSRTAVPLGRNVGLVLFPRF